MNWKEQSNILYPQDLNKIESFAVIGMLVCHRIPLAKAYMRLLSCRFPWSVYFSGLGPLSSLGLNHSSLKEWRKILKITPNYKPKRLWVFVYLFFVKIYFRKAKNQVLGCYAWLVMLNYIPNYLILKEYEI